MSLSLTFRISFVALILSATGCSTIWGEKSVFRGKSRDYLKTATIKPIELPQDMESRSLAPLYEIPELTPRDEFGDVVQLDEFRVPRPKAINTDRGGDSVKIQKIGDRTWIAISASTSQVWPRAQNFLSESGLRAVISNPAKGLIETADVTFKDDESRKSRFRLLIQKGIHPETTEIHATEVNFPVDQRVSRKLQWPSTSHSVEREQALIQDLASALAATVSNNSASLLGQSVGGDLKVGFLSEREEPTIQLKLFRERALGSVAHALEKDGFILWERSSELGIFLVGFDKSVQEGSNFISRMFKENWPEEAPVPLDQVLAHLSPKDAAKSAFAGMDGVAFADPLPQTKGYLVKVTEVSEDESELIIRDARGLPLAKDEAKYLLRLLRTNLI